jgi:hypothetical protein
MKKHALILFLAAAGSIGFLSSAMAGYIWVNGHWHLQPPCGFLQAVWCATDSSCTAQSGCNFGMSAAMYPPNGDISKLTKIALPNGKDVYVPAGAKPVGPSKAELATKK